LPFPARCYTTLVPLFRPSSVTSAALCANCLPLPLPFPRAVTQTLVPLFRPSSVTSAVLYANCLPLPLPFPHAGLLINFGGEYLKGNIERLAAPGAPILPNSFSQCYETVFSLPWASSFRVKVPPLPTLNSFGPLHPLK
jgi:hypothetical protein